MQSTLGQNNVSLLPQAFDKVAMPLFRNHHNTRDVVFVGMHRNFPRPSIDFAIQNNICFDLYGNGWQGTKAEPFVKASRVKNEKLCELYSNSRVILNDHIPEMRENGFCSNRIFDALACGTAVVSDRVAWVPEDIRDWVYFYDDTETFRKAVGAALNESQEKRQERGSFTNEFRQRHSFDNRAATILSVLAEKGLIKSNKDPLRADNNESQPPKIAHMVKPTSTVPIRGAYINLEQSVNRRVQCDSFLKQFHLDHLYERFPGIISTDVYEKYKHTGLSPGKIGCWLSHMEAIKASCDHDYHFHLLEDDFEITPAFPHLLQDFDKATSKLGDWDIIFTDFTLTNLRNVNEMKKIIDKVNRLQDEDRFVIEEATNLYAAGNSSYIVNKNSKKKVADILERGLGKSKLPKDIYLREEARKGNLKIFVTLPFLTTLNDTFMDSDILGRIDDRNPSIINNVIFRKSLSWGADTKTLLKTIKQRLAAQKPIGDRGMIYTHLVAHYVSDEYKNY
jgi:GR25 family glycosyltransferase involved in LPS biosynthesis